MNRFVGFPLKPSSNETAASLSFSSSCSNLPRWRSSGTDKKNNVVMKTKTFGTRQQQWSAPPHQQLKNNPSSSSGGSGSVSVINPMNRERHHHHAGYTMTANNNNNNRSMNTISSRTTTITSMGGGMPPKYGQKVKPQQHTTTTTTTTSSPEFQENQFELHEMLGQGHFGQLYRATLVLPETTTEAILPMVATDTAATTTTKSSYCIPTRRNVLNKDNNNHNKDNNNNNNNDSNSNKKKVPPKKKLSVVALKRFAKANLVQAKRRGGKLVDLLKREISIHRRLDHAHIVQYYGHCLGPTHLSLVLEYTPHGDLFGYLSRIPTSLERLTVTRQVMRQMAMAVDYLGRVKSVAHRDIKPENILVFATATATNGGASPPPHPVSMEGNRSPLSSSSSSTQLVFKLCDFGWAVRYSSAIRHTTLCGTPEYVPVEMLIPAAGSGSSCGRPIVPGNSSNSNSTTAQQQQRTNNYNYNTTGKPSYHAEYVDLWALGILLYELLHGFTPFCVEETQVALPNAKSTHLVYQQILQFRGAKYLPMDCITVECFQLMDSLLQIDPTQRCAAVDVVQHPFLSQDYFMEE